MLWASGYYKDYPLIRDYLERLDLSAGRDMFERYNRICPWYSEVIINRKHFISTSVRTLIGRTSDKMTIINLGAGYSPLSLELAPLLSPRCRCIEVDRSGMDAKHALYTSLVPDHCGFISCIEADISDTFSLRNILGHEAGHLVVVMEGLTYYLSRQVMEGIISALNGLSSELCLIFEHLKPCRSISERRRYIPERIFTDIRDSAGLDLLTTYTEEKIRSMLPPGFSCSYYDMSDMELQRTGTRTCFPAPECGWISCAVATRPPEREASGGILR